MSSGKFKVSDSSDIAIEVLSIGVSGDAAHVATAIKEWELIDVSSGDQTITIGGGTAHAIICDSDGTVLTVDTSSMTNTATPAMFSGGNPYGVTKVYQTGTAIVGTAYAVAW